VQSYDKNIKCQSIFPIFISKRKQIVIFTSQFALNYRAFPIITNNIFVSYSYYFSEIRIIL